MPLLVFTGPDLLCEPPNPISGFVDVYLVYCNLKEPLFILAEFVEPSVVGNGTKPIIGVTNQPIPSPPAKIRPGRLKLHLADLNFIAVERPDAVIILEIDKY